jgi:hypothetical protein
MSKEIQNKRVSLDEWETEFAERAATGGVVVWD